MSGKKNDKNIYTKTRLGFNGEAGLGSRCGGKIVLVKGRMAIMKWKLLLLVQRLEEVLAY